MNTIQHEGAPTEAPLAFHIRPLRQWHGEEELSQVELAARAGISIETVRAYERARELPGPVRSLLALARALRVPVEKLIEPRTLAQVAVKAREAVTSPPERSPAGLGSPWILAACCRAQYLGVAVVHKGAVVRVSCHALTRRRRRDPALQELLSEYTADFAADVIVVEPRYLPLHRAAAGLRGVLVETRTIEEAKKTLLGEGAYRTHRALYEKLVERHPQLRRLICRKDAMLLSGRWRSVQLMAVALALAGERRASSAPSHQRQHPRHYS